ncbi:hypothetical protein LTR08_001438 [Meristemomyces frigidus]|nr:hypothetical protein LTR08_001438 [Meristemomyces frigidus]
MALKHSTGSLDALYRVFVQPALSNSHTTRPSLHRGLRTVQRPRQHSRAFSASPLLATKTRAPEERRNKWDEEISARVVVLVDPRTDKLEEQPRTRYDILNTMDRKTHRLIQMSPDEPDNRSFMPVCKIVSKKEQYEHDKNYKKAAKERKAEGAKVNSVKVLELNWAIDTNDLAHRCERVAEFLTEGRRVEIVLAAKKRGRKATRAECEDLVKRIGDTVEGVPGAKELKSLDGKIGAFATIVLQGKAPSQVRDGGVVKEAE